MVLETGTNSTTLLGILAGVRAGVMQYWLPLDYAPAQGKWRGGVLTAASEVIVCGKRANGAVGALGA
jgi:hypothetical protein